MTLAAPSRASGCEDSQESRDSDHTETIFVPDDPSDSSALGSGLFLPTKKEHLHRTLPTAACSSWHFPALQQTHQQGRSSENSNFSSAVGVSTGYQQHSSTLTRVSGDVGTPRRADPLHVEPDASGEYCCAKCSYKSRLLSNVRRHMKSHSNLKPHACHLCSYRCALRFNLKNHMKVHTKAAQFKCRFLNCQYTNVRSKVATHEFQVHNATQANQLPTE